MLTLTCVKSQETNSGRCRVCFFMVRLQPFKKMLAHTAFRTNDGQLKMAANVIHVLSGYLHHGASLLGALAKRYHNLNESRTFLLYLLLYVNPDGMTLFCVVLAYS